MKKRVSEDTLKERDKKLIRTLESRVKPVSERTPFRNASVGLWLKGSYDLVQFLKFEKLARREGLLTIRVNRKRWRDRDGLSYTHAAVLATHTDMWPMGTNYWVRDNAIIAARMLFSGERRKERLGKELLLSALSFMSSVRQLERFRAIIRSRSRTFINSEKHWPYIFARLSNNLDTSHPEPWSHKQDAWPILAWYLFEALERGLISVKELSAKHREFLGLIVPFFAKTSFWRCENSGSWEEIPAVRTSVRAWQHRLMIKIGELAPLPEFGFLNRVFLKVRRDLGAAYSRKSLAASIKAMDKITIRTMLKDLPFEAPSYSRTDPKYREADAALIYLLELEYIDFIAERAGKSARWRDAMEKKLLGLLHRLDDQVSGGIARYENDSYQRNGFFRNLTVRKLEELYGAPSGDSSTTFAPRDKIVPKGRKAIWTHFVWQLAAWAGKRSLESADPLYRELHERYFHRGLRLITGRGEVSIDVDPNSKVRLISLPAWRMPECYISDRSTSGKLLLFPSPHTPLNWAVGEMEEAFRIRRLVLGI